LRNIPDGKLKPFWEQPACPDPEQPLRSGVKVVQAADWSDPSAVKPMLDSKKEYCPRRRGSNQALLWQEL
jgi:mRNA-degrading endonuclease HigB of HigAB toxin-antitoxin module